MRSQNLFRSLTAIAALGLAAFAGSAQAQTNNVQAALEGELLVVTGNDLANAITLNRSPAGDVFVVGRNGTTVNGLPSVRFRGAILNQVEILMFGGDDNVIVNNLVINNDLFVNLGDGNDTFRSGTLPSAIGASLTVEGGFGTETIRLSGWTVGSDAIVDGGIGILNSQMTGLTVGRAITLIGDELRDLVTLSGCSSGDYTFVETKGGNDQVAISGHTALGLSIATDAGADSVFLSQVAVALEISVNTGTHNDLVDMTDVAADFNITVSLDAGNDTFDGMNVFAGADAVFEGGAGTDTYVNGGVNGGIKTDVKEFEIFR